MQYDHLQSQFNGGEISKRLFGRVESDLYKRALETALNWQLQPHGPMLLRGGTEYIRALAGPYRLLELRTEDDKDFTIALGEKTLSIYDAEGVPIDFTGMNFVRNGGFDSGLDFWVSLGVDATLSGGALALTSGAGGTPMAGATQPMYLPAGTFHFTGTISGASTVRVTVSQSSTLDGLYYSHDYTAGAFAVDVVIAAAGFYYVGFQNRTQPGVAGVDDVNLTTAAAILDLPTGWTYAQALQVSTRVPRPAPRRVGSGRVAQRRGVLRQPLVVCERS